MKVSEYMTKAAEAQVAKPDTSLVEIAKQLTNHNCSCIVILEDKKPVGKEHGPVCNRYIASMFYS